MAQNTRYTLYHLLAGATAIGAVTSLSDQRSNRRVNDGSSGELYPRFAAVGGQEFPLSFACKAIATALGVTGVGGVSIAGLSGGLSWYGQKFLDGGGRAGSSAHRKFNATKGLLVPQRLSVNHQGDAELSCQAVIVYDGANYPVIETDSVSLPASAGDAERFALGPVTLESIAFPNCQGWELDFGVRVVAEGSDGDLYPTFAAQEEITPQLTLRGIDAGWLKSSGVPRTGLLCTHANTKFFLRKRALGGGFEADGSTVHVRFTMAGLALVETALDARHNDRASVTISLPGRYDGTNAPLVATTGVAIA